MERTRQQRELVDKSRELTRLKSLVRMFLRTIGGVPFRAIDCDQIKAYELWDELWDATKRERR